MRILLDESLPRQLAEELPDLDVRSVAGQRWSGLANGALIERAVVAGFSVLLTADQNLPYPQQIATVNLAVLVLKARTNRLQDLQPLVPAIRQALAFIQPGQVIRLGG